MTGQAGPRRWRLFRRLAVAILAILATIAWRDTMGDPVVRHAEVSLPGLSANQPALTLVLISDIHVAGPDMTPERLSQIVRQVNAIEPDIVLIAGDLVSDKRLATRQYSLDEAISPLSGLRPRIGTVAVLGNHDHWRDPVAAERALESAGAIVLRNQAVRLGPLTIGGIDDDFSHHADLKATLAEMDRLGPPFVALSHCPDPFHELPSRVSLTLAGHTHCGQIRFPLIGSPTYMSAHGTRYACGQVRENGRTLLVTAGLGTSLMPVRFGSRPDLWVVTARPPEP
jgi:uncharacterized protein